tara:strand:- start:2986 stop:4041 length:1056 start_codon:yes stop_codon:yes gene_type:complete
MEIIIPAAGASSRFPNMKPKFLLFGRHNKMMFHNAIEQFLDDEKYNITIGILKEHDKAYQASEFIREQYGFRINIVILDNPTRGPAETVYQILEKMPIDENDEIFIKDCDSFFKHKCTEGNYVCVSNISFHEVLKKLSSKSFIISNEQGIINQIIEKKVVSDIFCVGGYKFESAKVFLDNYREILTDGEIFVSDVIARALYNEEVFYTKYVEDYVDVGTANDWFEWNNKPVIFCDIDGTVVKSQSRVGNNAMSVLGKPLEKNVKVLLDLQKNGSKFVFTTAREKEVEEYTRATLDNLGFKDYELLIGLPNADRILINDFHNQNPYPRATAINLKRDKDDLDQYLTLLKSGK